MATREQNRRYYERGGKDKVKEHRAKHRERNRQFVRELKESAPCMDCGISYPHYVMDYDHREEESKLMPIANMILRSFSIEKLKAEIAKCDLVCANCHRIRTYERRTSASNSIGRVPGS